MQYMTDVEDTFTVLHSTGYTICGGNLTKNPDGQSSELRSEINLVKYYQKNNFKYNE